MNLKVFCLNENRYLETSSVEAFRISFTNGKSLYWVDIAQPDAEALSKFLSPLKLHPLILEGCLDLSGSFHVAPFQRSLFIKLSTQSAWNITGQSFLSIICLPYAVITIHNKNIPAIESITREFSSALRFHSFSTAAIIYQILDRLIDEDIAFVLDARRNIESLEEVIDQEPKSVQTDQILMFKQRAAHLSIICEDQRYCITALQTIESEIFTINDLREYFHDSMANLEYVIRSIDRMQAHLSELQQHYQLMLQERTNKRLKLLTILTAVFMPLTLIAGIYGMNFRYMPELTWSYGYPVVIALMLALAGGLLWMFYLRGWFK